MLPHQHSPLAWAWKHGESEDVRREFLFIAPPCVPKKTIVGASRWPIYWCIIITTVRAVGFEFLHHLFTNCWSRLAYFYGTSSAVRILENVSTGQIGSLTDSVLEDGWEVFKILTTPADPQLCWGSAGWVSHLPCMDFFVMGLKELWSSMANVLRTLDLCAILESVSGTWLSTNESANLWDIPLLFTRGWWKHYPTWKWKFQMHFG